MAIERWHAGAKNDPLNTKGSVMAEGFNQLVDNQGGLSKKAGKPIFAAAGDSITANGTIAPNQWTDQGWYCWFRRYCGETAEFRIANNFAVASTNSDHLVATQLPQLLASDATHVIVMCGNNDDTSIVDTTANYKAFYDSCYDAGIPVFFMPVMAHSAPTEFDQVRAAQISKMNQWLWQAARYFPDFYYIDTTPTVLDFSTGLALDGFHRDGTHTTIEGARLLGGNVYEQVRDLLSLPTQTNVIRGFVNDSYSVTGNPNGNIYTNTLLTGSSGAMSNGATGTVVDDVEVRRKSTDTTSTVVCSKSTVTGGLLGTPNGYTNLQVQEVTIGGTSNGNEQIVIFDTPNFPSDWVAGDLVEIDCMVKVENPYGIRGIVFRCNVDSDGNQYDGKDYSFDAGLTNQNVFTSDLEWTKYKVRKVLSNNDSTISIRLYVYTTDGVAMDAKVSVALPTLVKVV